MFLIVDRTAGMIEREHDGQYANKWFDQLIEQNPTNEFELWHYSTEEYTRKITTTLVREYPERVSHQAE